MNLDKMVKTLIDAVKQSEKKGTTPYDTTAEVIRIDGDTAWVHIAGGVEETPVKLTINAVKGDIVQLRVSGGSAWITGNSSKPPTDDSSAKKAQSTANDARKRAMKAQTTADDATDIATRAQTSANGKNTIYYDATRPTGGGFKVGDTWFNSSEDNAIYTWNGTTWIKEEIGEDAIAELSIKTAHIQDGAITNAKVGNLDAGKITTGTLSTNVLNVSEIISTGGIATDSEVSTAKSEAISTASTDATNKANDAKKVATNYLYYNAATGLAIADASPSTATKKVQISSTGIKIQQSASNYAEITSSGLDINQGGNSVAQFGSTIRLGTEGIGSKWVDISSSGFALKKKDSSGTTLSYFAVTDNLFTVSRPTTINGNTVIDGTLGTTGNITCSGQITATGYAYIKTPKASGAGGWARDLSFLDASNSEFARLGVYGGANTLTYVYVGANAYNGNNLRIYPDGVTWANGFITPNDVPYYSYLTNGSTIAIMRFNSSNELGLGNGSYVTRIYGSTVYAKGTSIGSDIRLKENIKDIGTECDKVLLGVDPISFDWKNDTEEYDGKRHYGIIAQELIEKLKEQGISTDKMQLVEDLDGKYCVCYTEMIPMLIHLCQSQQREIDELKEKVQ